MEPAELIRAMLHGPGHFRYIGQPLIALLLGFRDGRMDFRAGRPPYFVALGVRPGSRLWILRDTIRGIGVPFIVGIVINSLLQSCILNRVHLGIAAVSSLLLIAFPYTIARGATNRIMSRHRKGPAV